MKNIFQKTFFQVAVYLAIIAGLAFFFLVPSLSGILSNKKAIAEDEVKLKNLDTQLETLKKLSETSSEIDQKTAIISKYLPDNLDSSSFIVETEGLAKSLNIVIESFSISSTNKNSNAKKTTKENEKPKQPQSQFSITITNSFSQALAFVEQLENLSRFNTVSSISMSAVSGDQISLQLTGQIYYGSK
jgi:Tfp pilus assembly protein PilO